MNVGKELSVASRNANGLLQQMMQFNFDVQYKLCLGKSAATAENIDYCELFDKKLAAGSLGTSSKRHPWVKSHRQGIVQFSG